MLLTLEGHAAGVIAVRFPSDGSKLTLHALYSALPGHEITLFSFMFLESIQLPASSIVHFLY
jgi:hypothetical protein